MTHFSSRSLIVITALSAIAQAAYKGVKSLPTASMRCTPVGDINCR
jgi:hypothetical protein